MHGLEHRDAEELVPGGRQRDLRPSEQRFDVARARTGLGIRLPSLDTTGFRRPRLGQQSLF